MPRGTAIHIIWHLIHGSSRMETQSYTSQSADNSHLWSSCLIGQMRLLWDSTHTQNMKADKVKTVPLHSWSRITQVSWKKAPVFVVMKWLRILWYKLVESTHLEWFLHTCCWNWCVTPSSFFPEASADTVMYRGGENAVGAMAQDAGNNLKTIKIPAKSWFAFDDYHGLTILNNARDEIFLPQGQPLPSPAPVWYGTVKALQYLS